MGDRAARPEQAHIDHGRCPSDTAVEARLHREDALATCCQRHDARPQQPFDQGDDRLLAQIVERHGHVEGLDGPWQFVVGGVRGIHLQRVAGASAADRSTREPFPGFRQRAEKSCEAPGNLRWKPGGQAISRQSQHGADRVHAQLLQQCQRVAIQLQGRHRQARQHRGRLTRRHDGPPLPAMRRLPPRV
jgi:hypothetical protein